MAQVLVVADDLTGANATAAGFARTGLRSVTVGLGGRWDAVAEFHGRFDVVAVTTESRHAPPDEVIDAVRQSVRAGWPVGLVCCRIDTTLRGNVGLAAQTVLRTVAELSGRRTVGLCLPAHPAAGRQTVDGTQLLHGRRLEDTELARDPRSPVRTSDVGDVLRDGTDLTIAHVPLATVTGSAEGLRSALRVAVDADVVIGDAITLEHLERVAEAAATLDDVLWVAIDPGPGSTLLAHALGIRGNHEAGPVLAVSGSATDVTRTQLQALVAARTVHLVRPAVLPGSPVPDVDATAADLAKVVGGARRGDVVLLTTALEAHDVVPLKADEGASLPRALGRITRRVLEECVVDGLYTTGGDVTAAVLDEVGARGLEVEDEVVPLAVAGEIVDGPWDNLPIVTKGGLIGDANTAVECIDHLVRAAEQRRRRAHTAIPRNPHP